jgi:hypothetical protein
MKVLWSINLAIFQSVFVALRGQAKYGFGSKAPNLNGSLDRIRAIDCSGFARLAIYRATGGRAAVPDGSVNQREWAERLGLHKLQKYSDVQYAADDASRLFLCFIAPLVVAGVTLKAGHVWFVHCGKTIESSTPTRGVGTRHWNQLVFRVRRAVAFELPTGGN